MDWSAINLISDDEVCYCLTKRQATVLLGLTEYLSWSKRWENLGSTTRSELVDFKEEIQHRLLQMNCIQTRQSIIDPCILEMSTDGGDTWSLLFDYNKCLPSGVTDLVQQHSQDIIDALNTQYNGTPESVAPDLDYDGGADDSIRNDLICVAIHLIVQTMVTAEIERRARDSAGWVSFANLLETGAILLLGAATGGIAFAAAAAAAFLTIAADVWIDLSELVLNDDDAQDLVACCMYDAVRGNDLTFTAFSESLDSCGFTGGTFESQLAGAIAPLLGDLDVYLTFLKLLQDYWDLAKAGFLEGACPCPDDTWCVTHDFTADDGGWVKATTPYNGGGIYGGSGWAHEDLVMGNGQRRRTVHIKKLVTSGIITKISMVADLSIGFYQDNGNAVVIATTDTGVSTNVYAKTNLTASQGTDITYEWEDVVGETADEIRLFFRSSYDFTSPYVFEGNILVKSVEICGNNPQPPEV